MSYRLIAEEKPHYSVSRLTRVLGVSRAGFYAWSKRPPSQRARTDAALTKRIAEIHAGTDGIYGAPRIHAELADEHGIRVGRKRVARLMRRAGIEGVSRRRFRVGTTTPGGEATAAPDLVGRDFTAERPNQLWVADLERHEALSNRAVMKGHRLRPVAAGRRSWGQPGWRGRASPVASSPDNAGTSQYRQMTLGPASKTGRCT